jgi:ribosome-associated translation inhibitor RaiA
MLVLVSADHTVTASESLAGYIEAAVRDRLARFAPRITRVEVYLSDVNGSRRSETDKRCTMEAHVAGVGPLAAHDLAASLEIAVEGALDKLSRALDHHLGRLESSDDRGPPDKDIATTTELVELERSEASAHAAGRKRKRKAP